MSLSKQAKLRYCAGCRDDFYNGHNDLGVKECWGLESATLTNVAFVHLDSVPPWREPVVKQLSCHRKQRYVRISADHPQLAKNQRRTRRSPDAPAAGGRSAPEEL